MGGIKQSIKVDGRLCWTLFDTGARSAQLSAGLKKQLVIRSTIVNRKRAGMKIESAPRMKLPAKESLLRVKSFAKRKDKLVIYSASNHLSGF